MYSRSRSCLSKRKAHDLFKAQPRPDAPLDFLYPRWFSRSPTSLEIPLSRAESGRAEHPQNPCSGKGTGTKYVERARRKRWLWKHCGESEQMISLARRDLQELSATVAKRKNLARIVGKRLQKTATGSYGVDTVQVRRMRVDGLTPETPSQRSLRHMLYKAKHERDLAWTVPARILSDAMQLPAQRDGERILLPERTVLFLTGTTHENAWIHKSRGGCEVHVLPKTTGATRQREVILRGSNVARSATKEFLRIMDEQVQGISEATGENLERHIRWFPADPDFNPDAQDAPRADDLPIPEEWSVKTFSNYVEDLCGMRIARGRQRELYPDEETLHQNVASVLEKLFTSEELTPYLSSHAFNLALQFTCISGELGPTTDLLYSRAKQLGLHRQIWLFNIMIERALRMKRIDLLKTLTKDMQEAGVVPDGITWSKLLFVVPTAFARQHILDFIFRVFSAEFTTVQAHIAQRLVEVEMVRIVEKADGLRQFIQRMDSALGKEWLAARTLDTIIKTCADNKLWQSADEILAIATERQVKMLPSTIKALMYLHYQRGDLNAVIALLESPWVLELGYDSTCAIHWAFLTAWRRQRYNTCRVLWQYAATRGLISYQMQKRVLNSLTRNQNLAALPEHRSWEDLAGKLIIGTDLDTTNFCEQFPRLNKYFSTTRNPLQWLGQWTPNNGTREEQNALAYLLIHRDLEAWKVLKQLSRYDLPKLLYAARRKDQAWVLEKFDKHATLAEMLSNAIRVPLVPARQHRQGANDDYQPSLPLLLGIKTRIAVEPLSSRQSFQGASLSMKMATWIAPLLGIPPVLSWPLRNFFRALRMCGRVPVLDVVSMWKYLIQGIGLQSTHRMV
jgi:pentatricopeptide repeat protein